LWTSETPSVESVRREVLMSIHRAAYTRRHGYAKTLREAMVQEGFVMAAAGCIAPALDADDLVYTREILKPHLDASDEPTLIVSLFGDKAAESLGLPKMGLSERAGLALALAEARFRL
jgi:hypothetical protein